MKISKHWLLTAFLCIALQFLQAQYDEKYRPQFHFSAKKGWIGDPDGLIYSQGLYHLFWWGHAVSKDLVHWEELTYPMQGSDRSFSYFSGSVVVDPKNSAGFGENSMIALYTMHRRGDSLPETQGMSVSTDRVNFDFYKGNPVLDVRKVFFRDPQVFWHEGTQKWIMAITVPDLHRIHFYASRDLKEWIYLSEFGDLGPRSAFWECPDLFELDMPGEPGGKKWVLLIGQGPNRVQYFTGFFDGKRFRADDETIAFLNEGKGLPGKLFEGFDGNDFGKWKVTGTAFGRRPDNGDSIVRIGRGDAGSFHGDYARTGTLTSPEFTVSDPVINFLVAGGNHPDTACIQLLVENKVVRSTTGNNSDLLKWDGWDVRNLVGKRATIRIVDNHKGKDRGYIRIDHILFSGLLQPQKLQHGLWLDHGPDFYATRSYRFPDSPGHHPVFLGWMGNWDYANSVPSQWGRGFQSVPRNIALQRFPEGTRLVQEPVPALQQLRKNEIRLPGTTISGTMDIPGFKPARNTYEIEAVFDVGTPSVIGFNLLVGEGRKLVISYDPVTGRLAADRTNCSDYTTNEVFSKRFPTIAYAAVQPENKQVKLHMLVDESSVEIFTNQGKVALSMVTYPSPLQTGVQVFAENGTGRLVSLKAWELSSIWNKKQ